MEEKCRHPDRRLGRSGEYPAGSGTRLGAGGNAHGTSLADDREPKPLLCSNRRIHGGGPQVTGSYKTEVARMFSKRSAIAILAGVLTLPAFAADSGLWFNLGSLERGERIGIIQSDQKRIEGRFEHFSGSAITLRTSQFVTLPKSDVVRVYRRPRTHRKIRALIGGAVGALAGALLTSTAGDRFRNEGQDVPAGLWIAGASGIGAGIGAATGGGYETVYRRGGRP